MAFPNIFKKPKPDQKKAAKKKDKKIREAAVKIPDIKTSEQNAAQKPVLSYGKGGADSSIAWQVLERPHVTEKASDLAEQNQYVFRVRADANKNTIKRAVEGLYNVGVVSVRVTRVPAKKRTRGKIEGWRKGYKKAIVRVKEGQKIEILPR